MDIDFTSHSFDQIHTVLYQYQGRLNSSYNYPLYANSDSAAKIPFKMRWTCLGPTCYLIKCPGIAAISCPASLPSLLLWHLFSEAIIIELIIALVVVQSSQAEQHSHTASSSSASSSSFLAR